LMGVAAPAQASMALGRVIEQYPNYLYALQHQGKLLNDLRQHRPALDILERARAIAPQSARTLAEMGRAWYRLNNDATALASLDHAITFNPHYMPAWQYMLRMLSVNKDPSGAKRAEEASRVFPTCYPVALLGVAAQPREKAAGLILELLERFESTFDANSKPTALGAFREAILGVVKAKPDSPDHLALLARACEVFPESARLASAYGEALIVAGRHREGWQQQTRAMAILMQGNLTQEEFGNDRIPPLHWELANHILRTGNG